MYYNHTNTSKYKYWHVTSVPRRHSRGSAWLYRAGLRGSAMRPCVPRRIHVGSREKYTIVAFLLINLNT